MKDEMREALERCVMLLEAAGKAIEEDGWDMDFTHVDGIGCDHIGFATDCENAVDRARRVLSSPSAGAVRAENERCIAILMDCAQEFNRIGDPGMANHCRALASAIRLTRKDPAK